MIFVYLTVIILISILIKIPYLNVPLDADFGIYGYHGLFWLRNQKMPVKDTMENHPPGRWLLYAMLLKFFSLSKPLFRYSGIFFIVITQLSVYVIVSQFLPINFALLATLFYGILVSLPTFVWVQSNDEIEQSAFTAMTIALVAISPMHGSWIFFLAGIVAFMALFFKQSAYVNTFPPILIAIAIVDPGISNFILFFSGLIPGLLITGFYFYKKDMFRHFLNIFSFTFDAFKTHLDNIFYGSKQIQKRHDYSDETSEKNKRYIDEKNKGFIDRQKEFARNIYAKFFKQTLVFIIFAPFVFININDHFLLAIIVGGWLIFSAITVYINKHIMPYHFLPIAAPISIVATLGIFNLLNLSPLYGIGIIASLIILSLFIARNEIREIIKREKVQRGLMYINHPNEWLFFTIGEEIGKSLKEATTTEDRIYVWGAQYEIYLWAERPSPTRSLFCPHPSVSGYVPTPFLDEDIILQNLSLQPPKYIIIAAEVKGFDRFKKFLENNYYSVKGKEEEVQIYRWIFGDILPVDEDEAKERKNDLKSIEDFQKNESKNGLEIQQLLRENKGKNSISKLNKILEINPFQKDANLQLVNMYFDRGNVDGIMQSLHYLLMTNYENPFVAKTLGKICLLNEKYLQSEKLYRKVIAQDNSDIESMRELANSLFHQQKFEEAKKIYEKYLVENGSDDFVNEKLMDIYYIINRRAEAKYFSNKLSSKNHGPTELFKKINTITHNQVDLVDKPNTKTNIIWEGSQFVNHSLALVNREHTLRLIHAGFNLSVIPYEKDQFTPDEKYQPIKNAENKDLNGVDIHLRHQWPPNLNAPKLGHWVIIQPWEFGSLPKEWVHTFNEKVDEMWVPSTYVKKVYEDSGVDGDRVFVVPNGVDTKKFNPESKPYPLKTKKTFKILFVGGTIYRKGIDLLLKSYLKTFSQKDDICLVIKDFGGKSFYKNQTFKTQIKEMISGKNNPEIEYINEVLDEKDLVGLYKSCNVLIHPYRGEGFGLPILEAMACGIPTIITDGGAAKDFCNSRTSLFVKAKKISHKTDIIGDKKLVDKAWFWECDLKDLSVKMKYAYSNPEIMGKMGQYAATYVKSNWDWNIASLILQNRVRKLTRKPIYRYQEDVNNILKEISNAIENNALEQLQQRLSEEFVKSRLPVKLLGKVLCAKNLQQEQTMRKYIPELESIFADNPIVLNIIGIINFDLGNIDKSIEAFNKSLIFNENLIDTRRNLAELYIINEDYEKGISEFMEVLKQNPNDITSLIRMAEFSLETERYSEAQTYLNKVFECDPENEVALQLKNIIVNKNSDEINGK